MNIATDTSGSPVHIDFSLERRELFQASLQMVKRRLLTRLGNKAILF